MGLRIHRADSFLTRLGGLLARPRLQAGEALLLTPCNSVHTCFMRYAIDVVFLDAEGRVLRCVESLAPWRAALCWPARQALELAAGQARVQGLVPGVQTDVPFSPSFES